MTAAIVHDLPPLVIRGRELLPLVQGGMGVGVSAHRLAGTVAALGGMGTIAAVDLRRRHPDLMAASAHAGKAAVDAANLEALDREIRSARAIAGGRGMIAVNVMRAVSEYAAYVRQACASGADAIVMGAGLPLDLPELAAPWPHVALIPILSDARGIALVVRKWARKGRRPDAIVVEHPRYAGGHLGAARVEDLGDPRFDFERVLPEARAFFAAEGIPSDAIPLIPAGGIGSHESIRELIALGLYDREFVARYTNGGQLVIADPGSPRHGLLATDEVDGIAARARLVSELPGGLRLYRLDAGALR